MGFWFREFTKNNSEYHKEHKHEEHEVNEVKTNLLFIRWPRAVSGWVYYILSFFFLCGLRDIVFYNFLYFFIFGSVLSSLWIKNKEPEELKRKGRKGDAKNLNNFTYSIHSIHSTHSKNSFRKIIEYLYCK
jgi:hypothetical protein